MGDRANCVIRESYPSDLGDKEAVFIYSHWGGYELPEKVRQGLVKCPDRWADGSYLARVVAQTIIGGDDGTTGYGISTRLTDNEYDLIVLLPEEQKLVRVPEERYGAKGLVELEGLASVSFADYVKGERTWENLTESEVKV